MNLPRGYGDADLRYAPWPMWTWMRTPLYKQDHMYANQDDIFYCGRDIWPPDEWWMQYHDAFDLDSEYWVVESKRTTSKCADCQTAKNYHLKRKRDDKVGYWQQATEDLTPVISLDALAMLLRSGL